MGGRAASRRLLALAVVCAAAGTGIARGPLAYASRSGSGELSSGNIGVGIEIANSGQPGSQSQSGTVDSRSSSLPSLVRYEWTPISGGEVGSLVGLCDAADSPEGGTTPVFGWLYRVVEYTRDDRVISDTLECVAFPDPNDRSTPPPPPTLPTAPTIGDVWREVALPRPIVGANPVSRGVTGLDTQMWSGGGMTAQVAVTLGGVRVVGTAHVIGYRFSTDEGFAGSSTSPGDESHPVASHRFAHKGAHSISVSALWRANATMIVPGGAPVPLDMETAVLTATVTYPVVEVRTHLVG